ncbi:NAD(P)-dependent oxidoreductase [Streptomyces sp. NPDC006527]|uniref:NAD(P)-dependent oxidoreductase n=1 Tax=Streptomyces sp. NPDC006527 TaxID=3364749 RepID=UPI0036B46062
MTSARPPPITRPTTDLASSHGKHRCSTKTRAAWTASEAVPNLRLVITAGSGAAHIDLEAAEARGVTVAGSDSVSQAEHAVLQTLALIRNEPGSHTNQPRNLADHTARSYDIEGMHLGLTNAGSASQAVMHRLAPFTVHLHYTAPRRLPGQLEHRLRATHHPDLFCLAERCDALLLLPSPPRTRAEQVDRQLLTHMQRGSYLINCGAADLVDAGAISHALATGQLAGYSGALTVPPSEARGTVRLADSHAAGTATLSAQTRYAGGRHSRDTRSLVRGTPHPRGLPALSGRQSTALGLNGRRRAHTVNRPCSHG